MLQTVKGYVDQLFEDAIARVKFPGVVKLIADVKDWVDESIDSADTKLSDPAELQSIIDGIFADVISRVPAWAVLEVELVQHVIDMEIPQLLAK